MKILLIHPPALGEMGILGNLKYPPMGIAFLAAVLRENQYPVSILDAHVALLPIEKVIRHIAKESADVIGLSFTSLLFESAVALAKSIKRVFPEKILIAGGYHPTVNPEEVLREAPFDFVVIGEGERTVLDLLRALDAKAPKSSFYGIRGLAFWENGTIVKTAPRELIADIDEIPIPAYDLLQLEQYASLASTRTPFVTFIRGRGCPFRCIFCGVQKMFGRGYRCQSPDKTLQEIDILISQFGIKEILFKDSDFLIKRKNVLEFCEKLAAKHYDLIWSCNARVDEIDGGILAAMEKAGCTIITLGVESGNQTILETLKKDITLEQIEQACLLIKKSKIHCTVNFMFGNPGETWETIRDSINMAKRLHADYGNFSFLTAFPGSDLYDIASEKHWFVHEGQKDSFGYEQALINATHIPNGELEKILPRAYRLFYLRPSYIWQRLTQFNWMEIRNSIRGIGIILRSLLRSLLHSKHHATKNILDEHYHTQRLEKLRYRHQLNCRTRAVGNVIRRLPSSRPLTILDIGAADGMMAEVLSKEFSHTRWVNLDRGLKLLECASPSWPRVNADASILPFRPKTFDVVLLTAVIEHLEVPSECIQECRRMLKDDGTLIVTAPDPFFDRVAACLGFESKDEHVDQFTIPKIAELLGLFGIEAFQKEKFMVFPYPFPGDRALEAFYKKTKCYFLLMNQLVAGMKVGR